jgi:serine/threonine protein kinase
MSMFLVLDHCENGSLWSYLQTEGRHIPTHQKLTFCAEVARGMDYISARRVIHRDIAARNVLLDFAFVCKISDFGLSIALNEVKEYARFNEGALSEDELPVRWTAPEIFNENRFSTASDVWAYGIFVWEGACASFIHTDTQNRPTPAPTPTHSYNAHAHTHIHTHIYIHKHLSHTHTHTHTHTTYHTHTHTHTRACMYISTYLNVSVGTESVVRL